MEPYEVDWLKEEAKLALKFHHNEFFRSFFYGLMCLTQGYWIKYEEDSIRLWPRRN